MEKELPKRKNIRLQDYDYSSAGAYFITICVKDMHEMLGEVAVGAASGRPQMLLSGYGQIVDAWIDKISDKYPYAKVENKVVMPNHIHMILSIQEDGRPNAAPTVSIGRIIGYFKYQTIKEIDISGFWQRSYHDHIIRDEPEYRQIFEYITENPARWANDCYYT